MFLPCHIVIVKVGNNPEDTYKVNKIQENLLRLRVKSIVPHLDIHFHCYTDDPTGLETSFGLNIIPLELRDNITNPDFYKLDLFGRINDEFAKKDIGDAQMIMLDINTIPMSQSQKWFVDRCPLRGEIGELPKSVKLTGEQMENIRDNKLPHLWGSREWWDNNNVSPAILSFNYREHENTLEHFNTNTAEFQKLSFSEFLTNELQGNFLPFLDGIVAPFTCNDIEKNEKEVTAIWDERVRPQLKDTFTGSEYDDPDDKFCYADHEWKTFNRHCKFLTTTGNPMTDEYLRLWAQ
jgi:hypothetical protein